MTHNTPAWMIKAYEAGKATADQSYHEIVYGDLAPSWIFDNQDASEFFEIGRAGADFPVYATGWRYGDVPAGGRSYNYREQAAEHGVSVMQIEGGERVKTLSETRGSFDNRPAVKVGGWVHSTEVGGDGEPLLLACTAI